MHTIITILKETIMINLGQLHNDWFGFGRLFLLWKARNLYYSVMLRKYRQSNKLCLRNRELCQTSPLKICKSVVEIERNRLFSGYVVTTDHFVQPVVSGYKIYLNNLFFIHDTASTIDFAYILLRSAQSSKLEELFPSS